MSGLISSRSNTQPPTSCLNSKTTRLSPPSRNSSTSSDSLNRAAMCKQPTQGQSGLSKRCFAQAIRTVHQIIITIINSSDHNHNHNKFPLKNSVNPRNGSNYQPCWHFSCVRIISTGRRCGKMKIFIIIINFLFITLTCKPCKV